VTPPPDYSSHSPTHGEILLAGIVGSTAYGLARENSDQDRLGVFASPTLELCGLKAPKETHVYSEPCDTALHEAGKFSRLALACNPTVIELMWLDSYEVVTPAGQRLVSIRSAFLSASRVREAYLGYARSQLDKLLARGNGTFSSDTANRSAKHARHMARLVNQGLELYATGHLTVRVTNPDWYHEFSEEPSDVWARWFDDSLKRFESSGTCLPDFPEVARVEDWLRLVRIENLPKGITRRLSIWLDEDA
jgi:hypothetical protein